MTNKPEQSKDGVSTGGQTDKARDQSMDYNNNDLANERLAAIAEPSRVELDSADAEWLDYLESAGFKRDLSPDYLQREFLHICQKIIDGTTLPERGIMSLKCLIRTRYPDLSFGEEGSRDKYGVIADIYDLAYDTDHLFQVSHLMSENEFQNPYHELTMAIKDKVKVALAQGVDFKK